MSSESEDPTPTDSSQTITVIGDAPDPIPTPSAGLPATGSSPWNLMLAGLALAMVGLFAVASTRRRSAA